MSRLKASSKSPIGRMRKRPTYPHQTGTGNVLKLVTRGQRAHRAVIGMLHSTIDDCKSGCAATAAVAVVLDDGSIFTNYVTPVTNTAGLVCARAMEIAARRVAEGDD